MGKDVREFIRQLEAVGLTLEGKSRASPAGFRLSCWALRVVRAQRLCGFEESRMSPFRSSALAEIGCWMEPAPDVRETPHSCDLPPWGGMTRTRLSVGGCSIRSTQVRAQTS